MSALDTLRSLADASIANYSGKRRPTWAPPLVVDGELVELLYLLGRLEPDDKPIVRLWARWSEPRRGPLRCIGFEMFAGTERKGNRIFDARWQWAAGTWWTGPQWLQPTSKEPPRRHERFPLLCRSTELGEARVAEFAGSPAEQMKTGGILAGICSCCGRLLTDPISIDRGIGPECWGAVRHMFEAA